MQTSDQITISLTDYIDFLQATGTARPTLVSEIKRRDDYRPSHDFYRKFREAARELCAMGCSFDEVFGPLETQVRGTQKEAHYRELIDCFRKFASRQPLRWCEPPKSTWTMGELTVRLNPELGLVLKRVPTAIKLYLKSEKLAASTVSLINLLLSSVAPEPSKIARTAVLDVRTCKLQRRLADRAIDAELLKTEAAGFVHLYHHA